jgi:V/A-type H+/Na+-transporting ATPase subunit E
MSIKNITDKILSDAKEKAAEILANSKQEASALVNTKASEAASLEAQLISKAKEEAEAMKTRIIQGTELRVRNEKLTAKHQIIEKTFDYALESLEKLNGDEFLSFLKSTIKSYKITGEGILRVNAARHSHITSEVLNELKSLTGVNLTLGKAINNEQDGFVVEQRGIQINCTFESLVESLKEDLIFDVTKILFE